MDSALRPREIQARIRSGQSLEEVAHEAGVPAERIEPFAAPVIAEREHVARMALAATVRRRGETSTHRNLRPVVAERLTGAGVDPDEVEWDAWREEDRRWSVRARYRLRGDEHDAVFRYDQAGRFSVASNDDARWLISEPTREQDESDELALVRAVSSPDDPEPADEHGVDEQESDGFDDGSDEITQPVSGTAPESEDSDATSRDRGTPDEAAADEDFPTSAATPQEIASEVEAELDSYGVVPDGRSELDVLYDMLGGLAEDSINIYAGLSEPVLDEGQRPMGRPEPDAQDTGPEDDEHVVEVRRVESVEVVEVEAIEEPAATEQAHETGQAAETGQTTEIEHAAETDAADAARDDDDADDEDEPTNVRIPRPAAATDSSSGVKQGEAEQPEAKQPEPKQPETKQPETKQPETKRPEGKQPEAKQQASSPLAEPEQPSLVDLAEDHPGATRSTPSTKSGASAGGSADAAQDEQPEEPVKPAPKRKPRKRRASVPSWDEIMFGGPPPNNNKE